MTIDHELMRALKACGHTLRHNCIYNQSQNKILLLLAHEGPMSQKDLLKKMNIQPGSLSELVSKVEAAGYIEKGRSKEDKRVCTLEITEEGRMRAEQFQAEQDATAESLFKHLTSEQKETLMQHLQLLLDKWD